MQHPKFTSIPLRRQPPRCTDCGILLLNDNSEPICAVCAAWRDHRKFIRLPMEALKRTRQ